MLVRIQSSQKTYLYTILYNYVLVSIDIIMLRMNCIGTTIIILRPRQNSSHLADNILKLILLSEIVVFRFEFYTYLLSMVKLKYASTGSDNGSVPNKWRAVIWTNYDKIYGCIHASLELYELYNSWVIFESASVWK